LAPQSAQSWRNVKDVKLVQVALEPKRTLLRFVLLDEQKRRVVPLKQKLQYDVTLSWRKKGTIALTSKLQRDGVFTIELPTAKRPKACQLSIVLKFNNGEKTLETFLDDWLYEC